MTFRAHTDGASRGNPGESGIGIILKDEDGHVLLSEFGYIGETTNNVAEYTALLTLLKLMKKFSCTHLIVQSDSELMVRQLNGEYRVKDENLKKLVQRVHRLMAKAPYTYELVHIPREQNKDADRLANLGISSKRRLRA
jgi:ribonuclease HI